MTTHRIKILPNALTWLAYAGLVFPGTAFSATPRSEAMAETPRPAVVDIKLTSHGELTGRVVAQDSASMAGQTIVARRGTVEVARTTSLENGDFSFAGLKGGAYTLETPQGTYACRAWEPQAAPPSATNGILLVDHSQTVLRGQMMADACNSQCAPACGPVCEPTCGPVCDPCGKRCSPFGFLANPWVIGAAVAVAIAVPLALDDDDDAS
jgi:hypothetical protein